MWEHRRGFAIAAAILLMLAFLLNGLSSCSVIMDGVGSGIAASTYDTPGVSHVGIYVGNNMMIHCGDPISYANLNSSYWQSHFYRYGRLP